VDVRRRDQRPAELLRDPHDPLVGLVLLGDAVPLHFEVDLLWAEGLDQVVDVRTGIGRAILDQAPAEAGLQAAGERDHALGVRREQLHVHVRLAAGEALEEAGRAQLDQVAEAGLVRGEQGEVVALVTGSPWSGGAIVDQVGLHADDRLDPGRLARLVVLHRPVHHPVIGEAEGRHVELRGPGSERLDLASSIEQRVLAMDMQMDRSGAHPSIMPTAPERTERV
jgi:hypothetical protein